MGNLHCGQAYAITGGVEGPMRVWNKNDNRIRLCCPSCDRLIVNHRFEILVTPLKRQVPDLPGRVPKLTAVRKFASTQSGRSAQAERAGRVLRDGGRERSRAGVAAPGLRSRGAEGVAHFFSLAPRACRMHDFRWILLTEERHRRQIRRGHEGRCPSPQPW